MGSITQDDFVVSLKNYFRDFLNTELYWKLDEEDIWQKLKRSAGSIGIISDISFEEKHRYSANLERSPDNRDYIVRDFVYVSGSLEIITYHRKYKEAYEFIDRLRYLKGSNLDRYDQYGFSPPYTILTVGDQDFILLYQNSTDMSSQTHEVEPRLVKYGHQFSVEGAFYKDRTVKTILYTELQMNTEE